jgi:hypothetical protein
MATTRPILLQISPFQSHYNRHLQPHPMIPLPHCQLIHSHSHTHFTSTATAILQFFLNFFLKSPYLGQYCSKSAHSSLITTPISSTTTPATATLPPQPQPLPHPPNWHPPLARPRSLGPRKQLGQAVGAHRHQAHLVLPTVFFFF